MKTAFIMSMLLFFAIVVIGMGLNIALAIAFHISPTASLFIGVITGAIAINVAEVVFEVFN